MSKLFTVLLVLFLCILFGLSGLVFFIHTKNQSSLSLPFLPNNQPSPTPIIEPLFSLTLSPGSPTIQRTQPVRVQVILEAEKQNTEQPSVVQLEIAFDPNALLNPTIEPGKYFPSQTVVLTTINQHSGRISYALSGVTESTQMPGTIATLVFIPNPAFAGKETSIYFLPKSMIRGTITDTNLLMATYGTKLFFATGSAISN